MPHIKVAPFETKKALRLESVDFLGKSTNGNNELIMLKTKEGTLFFDLIKREKEYLIKPNKIAKGSQTELIKQTLNNLTDDLSLKVLLKNTNVKSQTAKSQFLKSIEDFYNFESNFKKIKVEVGFGSGRHLLHKANKNLDTLFIGIEIHTPSINQVLKQIKLQNLHNVLILNYDARLLLEMLPSNILDKIYVHFPVPWDKKPHRRVIGDKFTKEAIRVLKKDGILELRTDSDNYYNWALEVFSKPKNTQFCVNKNIDIEVRSKYEERWRKMQKDIYTLEFKSLQNSNDKKLKFDFNFNTPKNKILFPENSIVKDEFFVHFGRVYESLSCSDIVVEVSFGSFVMPEKKMIYIGKNECNYFPTLPVKSLENYNAHNIIKEVING